ncbi:Anoctamin-7 [Hypsibius exemplaris]|uniref:Anoctamin n=1 Tax=Hypsibius exemplaris TaxID=2072580 RepID=A0A1W0WGZ2_HYPEX|nr:Anoctamin-7 [Hypsibius exemplaris]
MYRTEREHEDSLAWKAYWFQFVNTFTPMFYIAFFKGRFVGYPGHRRRMAGMLLESCDIGGCFAEVGFQLIITMCGKQFVSNFMEFAVPAMTHYLRTRKKLNSNTELTATFLDQQYKLAPFEGLTSEYMEMVIQFGFIVLFGAAFPLAPMFSLLNNIFEIRLDARKLVVQSRRPLARRAQSIGIWFLVLRWMTLLSAFLIAFTSESLTHVLYAAQHQGSTKGYTNFTLAVAPRETTHESCRYEDFRDHKGFLNKFHYELAVLRLAFILCYVALTYFISGVISAFIPDTPKDIQDARKRRRFLATQALQSTPAAANEAYARVRTSTQINPLAFRMATKPSKQHHRHRSNDAKSHPESMKHEQQHHLDKSWKNHTDLTPDERNSAPASLMPLETESKPP